ncbi:hypothetical protein BT96DRAFT_941363 [Gymnopus androsaceus JB14]|uniref:Uncharacterized protein n=1 Tax=Gymnopus androsaceus JB14 TaxID=1447944 RepID=A0A6A4HEG9_9AGAR|nr:hypothetical protein BT96DRAFT_941363 [Gymnopus androsaceus JB14]
MSTRCLRSRTRQDQLDKEVAEATATDFRVIQPAARGCPTGNPCCKDLLHSPGAGADAQSEAFVPIASTRAAAAAELATTLANRGKGKARAVDPHRAPLGPLPNGVTIVSPRRPPKASSSRVPPPSSSHSPTVSVLSPAVSMRNGAAAQTSSTLSPLPGDHTFGGSLPLCSPSQSNVFPTPVPSRTSMVHGSRGSVAAPATGQSRASSTSLITRVPQTAGQRGSTPGSVTSVVSGRAGSRLLGPAGGRAGPLASPFPGSAISQWTMLARDTPQDQYPSFRAPALNFGTMLLNPRATGNPDFQSNLSARCPTPQSAVAPSTVPRWLNMPTFQEQSYSSENRIQYPPLRQQYSAYPSPASSHPSLQHAAFPPPMPHPHYQMGYSMPVYTNTQLAVQNFAPPLPQFTHTQAVHPGVAMDKEEDDGSDFRDPQFAVVPSIATPYAIETALNLAVISCLRKGWGEYIPMAYFASRGSHWSSKRTRSR